MTFSPSFPLFLSPNHPLATFAADYQCALVMVILGETPHRQMGTVWLSLQREEQMTYRVIERMSC